MQSYLSASSKGLACRDRRKQQDLIRHLCPDKRLASCPLRPHLRAHCLVCAYGRNVIITLSLHFPITSE